MAYFNSALAILILVLFNGCFTLPFTNTNLYLQNPVGLQLTSTTEINEHMGSDVSTPFSASSDNGKRDYMDSFSTTMELTTDMTQQQEDGKRDFDVSLSTTMEPTTDMTPQPEYRKRDSDASFSTTVESTTDKSTEEDNDKRDFNVSFSTTMEPTTDMTPQQENGKRDYMDSFSTTMEPTTDMTQQQENGKRDYMDSFSTTMEPTTDMTQQQENGKRDFDASFSTTMESTTDKNTEEDNDKREMGTESTTNNLFLSAASSNVVTKLSTPQSSTSPSKGQKYNGLLPSDNENQEGPLSDGEQGLESGSKPTKTIGSSKLIQKTTEQSNLQPLDSLPSDNGVEQNSTDAVPRMALYDQTGSDGTSLNLSGNMVLDENTMVVTDLPSLLSTSANKMQNSKDPLNQGKESLHTEKKKQNN